jgi:hypothetical protein
MHSIVLDFRSFGRAHCNTNHVVVEKIRESLAASKQATQKFDMDRFNLKKLNEVEGKEQHQIKISHRFAA